MEWQSDLRGGTYDKCIEKLWCNKHLNWKNNMQGYAKYKMKQNMS